MVMVAVANLQAVATPAAPPVALRRNTNTVAVLLAEDMWKKRNLIHHQKEKNLAAPTVLKSRKDAGDKHQEILKTI